MAYAEVADARLAVGWKRPADSDCDSLNRLAADQRETVAEHCPICRGEPGRCLVEVMEEVVAKTSAAETDEDEGRLPV